MKSLAKLCFILFCITETYAQSGLSLYSLERIVPQNANVNPAFLPDAPFILGLPLISEAGLHLNNKFSYADAIERMGADSSRLDVEGIISRLKNKNNFIAETRIPLFLLSLQNRDRPLNFSVFANERISGGIQYQKKLVETMWEGTNVLVGDEVNLRKTAASFSHFREYGLGIHSTFKDKPITAGVRIKLVQGIFNIKSQPFMRANISVDPLTYAYGFTFRNAVVNTAGIEKAPSVAYLLSNQNKGAAIDAGVSWEMKKLFSFSAAVSDLGFVRWKEGPQSFSMPDTTFIFDGIDMRNNGDVSTALDTLEELFTPTKKTDAYTAMLAGRTVLSGSLLLSPIDRLTITMMNQWIVGKMKSGFSVAYMKQWRRGLAFSGALTKLPQQWPTPGAALSVRGGPLQFYIASDNLIGFTNVSRMKVLDLRFGINIIPDPDKPSHESHLPPALRSKSTYSSKGSGLDYPIDPRLRKPKIFRNSGIYSVIPKRKTPKLWKSWIRRKERRY